MGKRVKLRKEQKLQAELEERALIEKRRRIRLIPVWRYTGRVLFVLIVTAVLLSLGVFVNNRIGEILEKLKNGGS